MRCSYMGIDYGWLPTSRGEFESLTTHQNLHIKRPLVSVPFCGWYSEQLPQGRAIVTQYDSKYDGLGVVCRFRLLWCNR